MVILYFYAFAFSTKVVVSVEMSWTCHFDSIRSGRKLNFVLSLQVQIYTNEGVYIKKQEFNSINSILFPNSSLVLLL